MFKSVWKNLSRRFERRPSLQRTPKGKNRVQLQVIPLEERALMTAGALDPGFSNDGRTQEHFDAGGTKADHVAAVALQADGKVVVVGWAEGPNGDRDFAIARFTADGDRDTSFGGTTGRVRVAFDLGGNKNDEAHAVVIQPDGKIVVAGQVDRASGDIDMGVIRLNADGTLDGGQDDSTPGDDFSVDGKAAVFFDLGGSKVDIANAVTLKGDKIVLAGAVQTAAINYDMGVAVLEATGDLDTNFSTGGAGVDGGDGRTTVAFDLGGLLIDQANAVGIQGGDIVIAGSAFTASNGVDMAVARLTAAGVLDSTFSPGGAEGNGKALVGFNIGGSDSDVANAMVIQPDGKIVLAGTVSMATAGDFDFGVARLTVDGALDAAGFSGDGKTTAAFDLGGSDNDDARAVALQSDGKILIAGTVEDDAGNTNFGIIRLTTTGPVDTTFGASGKAVVSFDLGQQNKDEVAGLALDDLDRIIVAGTVQRSSTGDTDFGVARLVADGPPAPLVLAPSAPETLNQLTRLIFGTAEAGSLVRVYRDVNNNNKIDPGEAMIGQQQLDPGATIYGISVPLLNDLANNLLVTATKLNSESAPTDVLTITDEGITVKVKQRADGTSLVKVFGATSGKLLKKLAPYQGTVRTRLKDFNLDGALDLYIRSLKNGQRRLQVLNGRNLAKLK